MMTFQMKKPFLSRLALYFESASNKKRLFRIGRALAFSGFALLTEGHASEYRQDYRYNSGFQEPDEKIAMSFYGPDRCGLKGIHTQYFPEIVNNFTLYREGPLIPCNLLEFDSSTRYAYKGSILPWKKQESIKERISALATVNLTYDIFREQASILETDGFLPEQSVANLDGLRLVIKPHDSTCSANAFYQRTGYQGGEGVLNFCSSHYSTVQLFDIVAHEANHAMLDALNPSLYGASKNHPHSAIHEAFADWGAVYTSLALANREGRTLGIQSFLYSSDLCIAKGWDGSHRCLRYPNTPTPQEKNSCEGHDRSMILTSLMVKAMRETYQEIGYDRELSHLLRKRCLEAPMPTVSYFNQLLIGTVVKSSHFNSLLDFSEELLATNDAFMNGSHQKFHDVAQEKIDSEIDKRWDDLNRCSAH